jgi:hypothetical protein
MIRYAKYTAAKDPKITGQLVMTCNKTGFIIDGMVQLAFLSPEARATHPMIPDKVEDIQFGKWYLMPASFFSP